MIGDRDQGLVFAFLSSGGGLIFVKLPDGTWSSHLPDLVAYELKEAYDAGGSFAGWRLRVGNTVNIFDKKGRISAVEQNGLEQVSIVRNSVGEPTSLVTPNGRVATFHYKRYMEVGRIDLPGGGSIDYDYDSQGRLTSVSTDGATTIYGYEDDSVNGRVQLVEKFQDGVLLSSFSYDASGRAISTENAGGINRFEVNYDDTGNHVEVTGPLGSIKEFNFDVYNSGRRLISESETCSDCTPSVTLYGYDTKGLLSEVNRNGSITTYQRDAKGRVGLMTEGAGTTQARAIRTVWNDAASLPASVSYYDEADVAIATQLFEYNARRQMTKATQQDLAGTSRAVTATYCEASDISAGTCPRVGLVRSVTGPGPGDITSFAYRMSHDASCATSPATCAYRKGDPWKVIDALGHVTETLAYDGAGRPLLVKDPNGIITSYEYHVRGWLTAAKVHGPDDSVESDDRVTRIAYWPSGSVRQVIQPDGASTVYTYDAAHRLTDVTDNAGNTIHYTLDNAGNRVGEDTKDAGGVLKRTLSRIYNQLSRLTTQADASANPTDFSYDANGNVTSVTDAPQRTTQSEYDPLNRLKRTLQDVGGIAADIRFAYDSQDNLTEVTDPKGLKTRYSYNGLGELIQQVSPDTGTTTFTYDSAGNPATRTDARNLTTTFSHDVLRRMTARAYADASLNVTYTYDVPQIVCDAAEAFSVGRLSRVRDGSGSTQYCYNRFGDLTRKVQTVGGVALTVRYAYSPGGQLTAMTYPDGSAVDYIHDGLGRVVEIGATRPGQARQVVVTNVTYAPFGPATGWTYGNGRQLQRPVDTDYRPQAVHDAAAGGLSLSYGYDPVGSITELKSGNGATVLARYGYDALGRLTQTQDGPTSTPIETYAYDATGNRVSLTTASGTATYAYPADSHRLLAVDGEPRTYDAAGNTLNFGGKDYVYSDANRMEQVKQGNVVLESYTYNHRGEQVLRTSTAGDAKVTLYDEVGQWLGNYSASGSPVQQAIWLGKYPVALISAPAVGMPGLVYIQPDHLGTPRVAIDPIRDVAIWEWSSKSEAFGNQAPSSDPDGDGALMELEMRFPGQQASDVSAMFYNYHRAYDPVAGRFSQGDPIGLLGGGEYVWLC